MNTIKKWKDYLLESINNLKYNNWILNKIKDEISKKYDIEKFDIFGGILNIKFADIEVNNLFRNDKNIMKRLISKYSSAYNTITIGYVGSGYSIDIMIKDLFNERVKPPKYIFHVSDKSNRKYILKFGLIPKSNVNEYGYYYGYDKPFIFATMKNNNLFMNNDNLDVWVIDTTKINNKWFEDFNYRGKKNHIITQDPIPPTALKIITMQQFDKKFRNKNFYYLFDELVMVNNIHRDDSDDVLVEYTKEDGSNHTYYSDYRDFKDDFIETNNNFDLTPKIILKEKEPKKDNLYNIIYYRGDKKIETLRYNLLGKLAFSLKHTLSKDPRYKNGIIKVEKI